MCGKACRQWIHTSTHLPLLEAAAPAQLSCPACTAALPPQECIAELLRGGHTDGIVCDVGMPVMHRGVRYNCRWGWLACCMPAAARAAVCGVCDMPVAYCGGSGPLPLPMLRACCPAAARSCARCACHVVMPSTAAACMPCQSCRQLLLPLRYLLAGCSCSTAACCSSAPSSTWPTTATTGARAAGGAHGCI